MGSLFGGSSKPPPPDTTDIDARESKLERQENDEKRKRTGGSAVGNEPIGEQKTLGYARNSRNV